MDLSDFDPIQYMLPSAHPSHPPNGISIGSADRQNTLRVTSVAIGRIYDMHAMRPKKAREIKSKVKLAFKQLHTTTHIIMLISSYPILYKINMPINCRLPSLTTN